MRAKNKEGQKMNYMTIFDIKSQDEMNDYLGKFNGDQKVLANMIFGLTWNMCAKMINEEDTEERFKEDVINYVKECDESDFFDVWAVIRKRHNDKMIEGIQ